MLKKLVLFGSIALLASLIICVGVYAYNADCNINYHLPNNVALWSSMNAEGLENGMYVLHVNFVSPHTAADSFGDGSGLFKSIGSMASDSNSGYATAFINGYDTGNGEYCQKRDEAYWPIGYMP